MSYKHAIKHSRKWTATILVYFFPSSYSHHELDKALWKCHDWRIFEVIWTKCAAVLWNFWWSFCFLFIFWWILFIYVLSHIWMWIGRKCDEIMKCLILFSLRCQFYGIVNNYWDFKNRQPILIVFLNSNFWRILFLLIWRPLRRTKIFWRDAYFFIFVKII